MDTQLTIQELYNDKELVIKKEQLNTLLNATPPAKWVKEHPYIKGWMYLPIDKVEFLLKKLFKTYKIEVLKTGILFNAIEVGVRVHYLNPVTDEMDYQDGVGAVELQTQKGSGVLKPDFSNVNKGAVTMALPIAKTFAIKDACELIGGVFGGNLNRKDVAPYEMDKKLSSKIEELL